MKDQPGNIKSEFIVLSPDKKATLEKPDQELYERLDRRYDNFAGHELISCHEFSEDWAAWEIHPKGDEIVILLSGEVTFILDLEDGKKSITLYKSGDFAIVPQSVWHTAKTNLKSKVLFITPGEGTEHKTIKN